MEAKFFQGFLYFVRPTVLINVNPLCPTVGLGSKPFNPVQNAQHHHVMAEGHCGVSVYSRENRFSTVGDRACDFLSHN